MARLFYNMNDFSLTNDTEQVKTAPIAPTRYGKLDLRCMDNMELMAHFQDNHFELAIVDPPYGIGDKFKGGKNGKMQFNEVVNKGWDKVPSETYWKELMRVSKNQIVLGGNYFDLQPSRCWIVWDKMNAEDFSLAMCELAWTSFDEVAKIYRQNSLQGDKIHPTQKPVALYKWLLKNYAKQGDKILDTHLGSGSIAIACHYMGFDLTGCELDADYFSAMQDRIKRETQQLTLL
jgi:site-specific DNA-methyltransferase (adenine-specific)